MMKKLLWACATVGLAAGAGYLLYRTWKSYYGVSEEEDDPNEAVRKDYFWVTRVNLWLS